MMSIIKAKISWISKERGGRESFPTNDLYGPQIKITKPLDKSIKKVNWSLIVKIIEVINEKETISEIKYLSDDAPDNLYKGVEFELYEGSRLVATGVIL